MIKFCLKNAHTRQILFAIFLVTGLVNCGIGTHANPLAATPSPQKQYGVQVSSPANNSTVGTTVNFAASAATTCATGVASIGIFTAPGVLAYKVNGATLNTNLSLNPAIYNTTVQAWDNCGGTVTAPVNITVSSAAPPAAGGPSSSGSTPGNSFGNLHEKGGWTAYVLLPPSYSR